MKKIHTFLFFVFILITIGSPFISRAQEAAPQLPPDCTTDATLCMVPFDGGVFFLVFFALSFGVYKIYKERIKLKLVN